MTKLVDGVFETEEQPDLEQIKDAKSYGGYVISRISNQLKDSTLYVDYATGRQWLGHELEKAILDLTAALVDELDLQRADVVCIRWKHCDYALILGMAIICSGGVVCWVGAEDPYAELLYLAQKVRPRYYFGYDADIPNVTRLEQDLNQKLVFVSMNDDNDDQIGKAPRQAQDARFSFWNLATKYDHKQAKCRDRIPVECDDLTKDVAMILMSSGTTGRPKAIAQSHANCLADCLFRNRHNHQLTFVNPSSLDYLSCRMIGFGALTTGFRCIVMPQFEVATYLDAVQKYKVDVIFLGATSFQCIITSHLLKDYDIRSVKIISALGAKIVYVDDMKKFIAEHEHVKMVRGGYAASETSLVTSFLKPPGDYINDIEDCGVVRAGMRVRIVDTGTRDSLGYGQVGSIRVSGAAVFRGYVDRSLSVEEPRSWPLINDSSVFDEQGYYITGDTGYFAPNGNLYLVGRDKELMCCLGAKKVVPQELEELLHEHPAVLQACVFGVKSKGQVLCDCPRAFVVPTRDCYDDKEPLELLSHKTQGASFVPADIDDYIGGLELKGCNKSSKLSDVKRRELLHDLMRFIAEKVSVEKRLTGGIAIIDEIPTLRSTGKMNKIHLRSLSLDQVEIYGDQSD